jgi:plasmid maintenance system antidote protein VapI
MATLEEPLGNEDLDQILLGIERADKIIHAINRASRVGMDMAVQLEEVRGRRKQLLALKNEYFPGR